ncbi:MAG: tol-pal system protein YbgF [Thiohalocapsa sp.]|nr:tol-pal system protein YbgF [Thiohalocapsa sp.]
MERSPKNALGLPVMLAALMVAVPAQAQPLDLNRGLQAGIQPGVEARLERLERMLNEQSVSDLVLQLQRLQQEVQELRGLVEMQQYRMQRDGRGGMPDFSAPRFDDTLQPGDPASAELGPGLDATGPLGAPRPALSAENEGATRGEPASGVDSPRAAASEEAPDDRQSGEPGAEALPQTGLGGLGRGGAGGGLLALPSPETTEGGERDAYRAAFEQLKERDYAAARSEFTDMLSRYPQGQYSDNARYWLGEIGYMTKDYASAMAQFNRLLTDYPLSPKVPSAMLKLGYVYYEQNDLEQAGNILQDLKTRFPNTTEGRLAEGRLELMTRDGN